MLEKTASPTNGRAVKTISVTELADIDEAPIIDVRERDEFAAIRAAGAVNIPMSELVERIGELPEESPIYLICRSGARSGRVAEYLAAQDYDVVNVDGGTEAWVASGLPTASGATV